MENRSWEAAAERIEERNHGQCLICLEAPTDPYRLPCGHVFCAACLVELRVRGVTDACPLCAAPFPPQLLQLHDLAYHRYLTIRTRVQHGEFSWGALPAAELDAMQSLVKVLRTFASQAGHELALALLTAEVARAAKAAGLSDAAVAPLALADLETFSAGSSPQPAATDLEAYPKERSGKKRYDLCAWCQKPGAEMRCTRCKEAVYCNVDCQGRHWRGTDFRRGHRSACDAAFNARRSRKAWAVAAPELQRRKEAVPVLELPPAAGSNDDPHDDCSICLGPLVLPVELPCSHAYCQACLASLRAKSAVRCPLCRSDLPDGLPDLYEAGFRICE